MSISQRITCCFLLSGPRKETHCRWIAWTSPSQQTQEVIRCSSLKPRWLTGKTGGFVQTGGVYAFIAMSLSEFRLMWGRYLSTSFSLGEKCIFAVLSSDLVFCWCVVLRSRCIWNLEVFHSETLWGMLLSTLQISVYEESQRSSCGHWKRPFWVNIFKIYGSFSIETLTFSSCCLPLWERLGLKVAHFSLVWPSACTHCLVMKGGQ